MPLYIFFDLSPCLYRCQQGIDDQSSLLWQLDTQFEHTAFLPHRNKTTESLQTYMFQLVAT